MMTEQQEEIIRSGITYATHECHAVASDKGWWDEPRLAPECFMLMVSEIAEALEEYRNNKGDYYIGEKGKPEGIGVELADLLIRVFDYCGKFNIDIGKIIIEKMKYNETRPYRHGNKVC